MELPTSPSKPIRGGPAGSLVALPEYILNTFFPGAVTQLSRYPRLAELASAFMLLFTLVPWTYRQVSGILRTFSSLLFSSISVSSDEDLFEHLSRWMVDRTTIRKDQSLIATTDAGQERARRGYGDRYDDLNRRAAPSEAKILYEQSQGLQLFFFGKRLFVLERSYGDGSTYNGRRSRRTEILTLACFGRSTQPIKDLLQEVHQLHKDKERSMTIIRRPTSGDFGGKTAWARVTAKPRRDLDTVILDSSHKFKIVADIDEYLDPSTRAWYADRGIPYRRGYLFYGPPGTGKTSFAMALASRLSLDIYSISLLDRDIKDSDLITLLNQLPRRCLLLLEDIDTAGLSRKPKNSTRRRFRGSMMPSMMDVDGDSDEEGRTTLSSITLSGLLNAIDGVAAPEGHILIMTTNKPDELDEAVVRSGRISVRTEFRKSSHTQAQDIFLRMYQHQLKKDSQGSKSNVYSGLSHGELVGMAKTFAEKIPEDEFSPADLQDYLLLRKKEPWRAVDELEAWKRATLEERVRKAEEQERENVQKSKVKAGTLARVRKMMMESSDGGEEMKSTLLGMDGVQEVRMDEKDGGEDETRKDGRDEKAGTSDEKA